jgi:hypothetical protein
VKSSLARRSGPLASVASLASPASLAALPVLAALALAACEPSDTQFHVDYAPVYRKAGGTVSVLGVFREGRMSPDTWDEIAKRISPAFGQAQCPVFYDSSFLTNHHDLAEAVDDYARANGVTDDLVDQLAPAAGGDQILLLTVAGRPLDKKPATDTMTPASAPVTGMPAGRQRSGGLPPPGAMHVTNIDRNAFEISASLFSVPDHKSVASVTMGYSGQDANLALAAFIEKLKTSLPGLTCAGWKPDVTVDEKKIRDLKDE